MSWTFANGTTYITVTNDVQTFRISKFAQIQMSVTEPILYLNYSVNNAVVDSVRVSGVASKTNSIRRAFAIDYTDVTSPVEANATDLMNTLLGWLQVVAGASVADGSYTDITVSGAGTVWTINNGVVTFAKIANMNTNKLLGRGTAGAGVIEEITLGTNLSLAGTTLNASGGLSDGDKGDITVSGSGATWTIDNDVVTYAKIQNVSATDKILGRSTAGAGDVEEITCTSFARTILDDTTAGAVRTTIGAGTGSGDMLAANNLSDVASVATSRTNLGLGTGDSPQFTAVNIGNASDTTVARTGAGDISVEGNLIYRAGGTDVPVTDGGTGSSTAAGARASLLTMFTVVMVNTVGTLVQNTTYYFGAQGNAANTTANRRFKKIPFACILRGATITMVSSNAPSTENNTVVLSINNGSTNVTLTSTFASSGANCTSSVYTGFSQAIAAGDTIEIKYTTNATLTTAPANCGLTVDLYFE